MNIDTITSQKSFNKTFQRNYLTASFKRFFLVLFSLILGLFPIFINYILTVKPKMKNSSKREAYLQSIRLIYLNSDLKRETPKKVQTLIIPLKNELTIEKQPTKEEIISAIPDDKTNENGVLLADDSSLDDILATILKTNEKVKESQGSVFVENFNKAIDKKRAGNADLNRLPKERKRLKRTWKKEEIKMIDQTVLENEKSIYLCYSKFRDELMKKRGFVTVQFEISPRGKLVKKSVKLLDTSIENKDFLNCVLKRTKYFRGFPKASNSNAENYVFQKKWYF